MKKHTVVGITVAALTLMSTQALANIDASKLPPVTGLHQHSDSLVSAGLPSEQDLIRFQQAGVDVIVSVIPPTSNEPQPNIEAMAKLGLRHVNVPFDSIDPLASMARFNAVMAANQQQDLLVHCAINLRASGMVYLYHATQGELDRDDLAPWQGKMADYFSRWPTLQTYFDTVEQHYGLPPAVAAN